MTDSNRIFYGCTAINLWSPDNKISSINGFLEGVQSLGLDSSFENSSIIDYGRPNPIQRLNQKPIFNITLERLISKQAPLFLKTDIDLISGIFDSSCPEHDLLIIYGPDSEAFVRADETNDLMLFQNMVLKTLSYSISIQNPSLRESISLSGRIQKKEASIIMGLVEPQYAGSTEDNPQNGMIARMDYRSHKISEGSILPLTVEEWVDYTEGMSTEKQFIGLTSIDISCNINHKELVDIGKWRGANPSEVNRYNLPLLPIDITCSFKFNAKRSIRKDLTVTDDNFSDEEIKIIVGPFAFNLGEKNKLVSINKSGGSTNGEIIEYELSYSNTNFFRIDELI
jgi:hypothetical protein